MQLQPLASNARMASVYGRHQRKISRFPLTQRGFSLIELMVGIAIGLLVVAVALGALMVSRGVSGTVSDASNIQQQGAYAMRVMGQQLRQSGSLRLNLNPGTSTAAESYLADVGFEISAGAPADPFRFDATKASQIVSGAKTPETLNVGYQRYAEAVFTDAVARPQLRNCVGGPADASTNDRIESVFQLVATELQCSGNGQAAQPVVQNVANFQVRYFLQDNTTSPGIPTIKAVDASAVGNWAQVQAVEVCLVLYGTEVINLPTDGTSTYIDCDGITNIDMTTLPADTATVKRRNRMHLAFRNIFQLRSQGLIGTVLLPS